MKFTIETNLLKEALSIVNHATASITTTPILESILIKVNFNNVVFTSNNLEMAIEYVVNEGISDLTEGAFCIPSKLFTSYVSLVQDNTISLELIKNDSLELKSESGDVKIKGVDAGDFPLIPGVKEETSLNLKGKVLKKAIEKTLFSSAEGNIRPTLAGIFVNIDGNIARFASTDSFRLSEYKTTLEENINNSFSQIIPSKTTNQLKSIIKDEEDVKIISGDNQIAFIFGNTKFYSRLLNGKFPDYTTFFPEIHSTKAEINRVELIQALRKINLISKENNYSIKMVFDSQNGIILETNQTQIGEGEVRLVGVVEGENTQIGINSTYFLEVLGVIETTHISIKFENPLAPILITPLIDPEKKKDNSEFRHIIMPLKL
ncbi:MAG: DNA polymerase III subunit beta [Candidatus Gracilibacteria bacterium]|nr:DNA polymerase III subunit beta [Candidatus Gracilibacteria bacterium]